MKKPIALLLCTFMVVVFFAACGGTTPVDSVSLFDLKETMLNATTFGDMAYVSSEDQDAKTYLETVSSLAYEKVDGFFISYARDGKGNADEIVVLRVKNPADTAEALQTLQMHLKTRQSLYATYDPAQSQKIGQGITFQRGAYAVLIVSNDNGAVKQAFESFLEEAA